MVNPPNIPGTRLAMIAWGKKASEDEDDVVVFTGLADRIRTQPVGETDSRAKSHG